MHKHHRSDEDIPDRAFMNNILLKKLFIPSIILSSCKNNNHKILPNFVPFHQASNSLYIYVFLSVGLLGDRQCAMSE